MRQSGRDACILGSLGSAWSAVGASGKPDKIAHRPVRTWGVAVKLQELVDGDPPVFSPARIAGVLRTTKTGVAGASGLSQGTLSRTSRVQARKTQTRPREMVEILRRVEAYTGSSPLVAYAWFRSDGTGRRTGTRSSRPPPRCGERRFRGRSFAMA